MMSDQYDFDDMEDRAPMTEAIEEYIKLQAERDQLKADLNNLRISFDRTIDRKDILFKCAADLQSCLGRMAQDNSELTVTCDRLKAENERLKEMYAAHIGDEHDQCGTAINQRLQAENERLQKRIIESEWFVEVLDLAEHEWLTNSIEADSEYGTDELNKIFESARAALRREVDGGKD